MKLLIVDAESKIADLVRQCLTEAGFLVDVCRNGPDGNRRAMSEPYDLIILDVMLSDIDGWHVLKSIRASDHRVPVLVLSARGSVDDRVKGLDLGADDYMVKPFAFVELLARVRTLLRRGGTPRHHERLKIANLELDLARRCALRDGQRIALTNRELALLNLLLRRPGEVLPRSLMASQVWGRNFDCDTNLIDVAIRRLRAKIDNRYEPKLIHTVRGMGYMLDAPDDR
jgi:two-component system copper resistance phosphate regulon response regulator CusR